MSEPEEWPSLVGSLVCWALTACCSRLCKTHVVSYLVGVFELDARSCLLFLIIVVKQDVAFPCQQQRKILLFYPVLFGELERRLNLRALLFSPGWFVTLAEIGYSRMFFLLENLRGGLI